LHNIQLTQKLFLLVLYTFPIIFNFEELIKEGAEF